MTHHLLHFLEWILNFKKRVQALNILQKIQKLYGPSFNPKKLIIGIIASLSRSTENEGSLYKKKRKNMINKRG